MGWLWLALIAGAAFLAMRWLGVSRRLATLSSAALALGGAGYAWQQHANLPGHVVTANASTIEVDPGLVAFRSAIMPGNEQLLSAADDRLRAGDPSGASQILIDALAKRPQDAGLWAGLGRTIAAHDGGQVSPASLFAFRKAMALAPDAPGPPFMLGLAQIQARQLPEAKISWLRALTLVPRDAPYRFAIAERLMVVDQFIAMRASKAAQQRQR